MLLVQALIVQGMDGLSRTNRGLETALKSCHSVGNDEKFVFSQTCTSASLWAYFKIGKLWQTTNKCVLWQSLLAGTVLVCWTDEQSRLELSSPSLKPSFPVWNSEAGDVLNPLVEIFIPPSIRPSIHPSNQFPNPLYPFWGHRVLTTVVIPTTPSHTHTQSQSHSGTI